MYRIFGIEHIQVFATKPGIIKTKDQIQGAILKGIGSDYDWSFFSENLKEGTIFQVSDTGRTDKVLISGYLSKLLKLKVGDRFAMYFIDERPRARPFTVSGIYETSLEEFDRQFVLADINHIQSLNDWNKNQVSGFEVILNNFDDIDYMTYVVSGIAGARFYEDGSKLRVLNIKQKYPQIFDWLGLIDWNVLIILTIMLVVAFFNTSSGLLIMILDRTNMIGILKAIGSENRTIRRIFMYQAGYLLLKGLFWGNLIGLSICFIEYYFKPLKLDQGSYFIDYVPIHFNIGSILLLNAGTLVLTLVVLLLPSLIISRISPARTIRFN
ncbi:MAG: ABC transporter permease [Bacteroidales bacterium]|nr:ABC transporter permease [Bacteroidales bacterium]